MYAWHFSDGEDFAPERTIGELKRLLAMGINMFGYGEIDPGGGSAGNNSNLMAAFEKALPVLSFSDGDFDGIVGKADIPFLGVALKKKEHILMALRQFLKKDRWSHD